MREGGYQHWLQCVGHNSTFTDGSEEILILGPTAVLVWPDAVKHSPGGGTGGTNVLASHGYCDFSFVDRYIHIYTSFSAFNAHLHAFPIHFLHASISYGTTHECTSNTALLKKPLAIWVVPLFAIYRIWCRWSLNFLILYFLDQMPPSFSHRPCISAACWPAVIEIVAALN